MYSEGQVIYLDEAWDQTIKKKALEPLEDMLEKGVEKKKQLAEFDEYVAKHGVDGAVKNYQEARQGYYEKLKTFETFGRGWTRRVNETTESALKMI